MVTGYMPKMKDNLTKEKHGIFDKSFRGYGILQNEYLKMPDFFFPSSEEKEAVMQKCGEKLGLTVAQ